MQKSRPKLSVHQGSDGAWGILVNEMPLQTPAGHPLIVPSEVLARLILTEMDAAYGVKPVPPLPHRQLANTAIDKTAKDRVQVERQICGYAMTELLCHRAEHPRELVLMQEQTWQPWLDWCAEKYGIRLVPTSGLMPIEQPAESLAKLQGFLSTLTVFDLTVLRQAVDVLGSLVLGLGMYAQVLSVEEGLRLSELDQNYQAQHWGSDPEHQKKQHKQLDELAVCAQWFGHMSDI